MTDIKNDYEFRPATIWDAERISKLYKVEKKVNETEQELFFYLLVDRLKYPEKYLIYVIEKQGDIIGFFIEYLSMNEHRINDLIGFCDGVYIDSEHRGGNLFPKAISIMTDWAKGKGCSRVQFLTDFDKRLIDIYKRLSFSPSQILFEKELSND